MNSTLLLICAAFILALVGCSTPSGLKPIDLEAAPGSELSRLILFRKSKFAGSGTFPDIHVDGTKQGQLYTGSYMIFELPPGEHTIVARGNFVTFPFPHAEAKISMEGGKDYYLMFETDLVDFSIVSTSWTNGFYSVSPEFGSESIRTLKRRL